MSSQFIIIIIIIIIRVTASTEHNVLSQIPYLLV